MRLYGMHDAFKNSLETTLKETLSADEFIRDLVNSEWDDRQNRTINRLTRLAGFRYKASIEGIDYPGERGPDRNRRGEREQRSLADYAPQGGEKQAKRS